MLIVQVCAMHIKKTTYPFVLSTQLFQCGLAVQGCWLLLSDKMDELHVDDDVHSGCIRLQYLTWNLLLYNAQIHSQRLRAAELSSSMQAETAIWPWFDILSKLQTIIQYHNRWQRQHFGVRHKVCSDPLLSTNKGEGKLNASKTIMIIMHTNSSIAVPQTDQLQTPLGLNQFGTLASSHFWASITPHQLTKIQNHVKSPAVLTTATVGTKGLLARSVKTWWAWQV